MSKKKKQEKLDKKELKQPDQFVQVGESALDWIYKKRKVFFMGVGLILAISAFVYGFQWWSQNRTESAWAHYYQADIAPKDKRIDALKKMATDYSSHRVGTLSATKVADYYFDLCTDNPEDKPKVEVHSKDAIEYYTQALNSKVTKIERPLLLINRGKAYELNPTPENLKLALKDFENASKIKTATQAWSQLSLARYLIRHNDATRAQEVLTRIQNDYKDTEFAKEALKESLFMSEFVSAQ